MKINMGDIKSFTIRRGAGLWTARITSERGSSWACSCDSLRGLLEHVCARVIFPGDLARKGPGGSLFSIRDCPENPGEGRSPSGCGRSPRGKD